MVWELIEESERQRVKSLTERLKVDGGFLYRTQVFGWGSVNHTAPPSVALIFVPEPVKPEA